MRLSSRVLKPDQVAFRLGTITLEKNGKPDDVCFDEELGGEQSPPEQLEWVNAVAEREQILQQARDEARQIIAEARAIAAEQLQQIENTFEAKKQEIEVLRDEARNSGYDAGKNEGFQQGFEEGRQAGMESIERVLSDLRNVLEEAQTAHDAVLSESRTDLVKLAVAMAEKMLCRELSKDDEFPGTVLESMLHKVESAAIIGLRISPSTLQRWKDARPTIIEELESRFSVSLISDESLEPGDIMLDTNWGFVDGRIRNRWRRILEGIGLVEACAGANASR